MKNLITTTFAILLIVSLYAQAPQAFNYQGVARDLSNNPIVNQNIGLQIAILQNDVNGNEVYRETHNVTTTDLGLFNLQIGTGVTLNGTFENLDWGSSSHFLQIEMDVNGGTDYEIIGITELLSVPYALHASNGSKWEENNNGIHFTNGNVGIGNVSPRYPLDVNYNDISLLHFRNNWNNQNNGTQLLVGHSDDGFSGIYFDAKEGDFIGSDYSFIKRVNNKTLEINNLDAVPIEFLTNNTLRLKVDDNGNIGIGVDDPNSKLQISGGDIYIEDINNGVIMKSPNGQCWRMTVSNSGQPELNSTTCPK